MSTMEASVNINLAGNLAARARALGGDLTRLGQTGQTAMRMLSSGAAAAGRGLDAMANRYTAFATGATMTLAAKKTMETERRFTRLGIAANASEKDMARLKQGIYDASMAPDVKIDPTQLTDAVDSILEKTGDLKFAEENLQNLARTIQATGAEGAAVGEIFAEMQKQDMSASATLAAVDTLAKQGKEGAFTLKDLARLGPRVVTAYTALGRVGPNAMQEMGAMLQVIRQGTGSSEEAATAWAALLRTFTNKDKIKFLKSKGINVFDKDGAMRDVNEIVKEMVYNTNGEMTQLGEVLDDTAKTAFNAIVGEFKRSGAMGTLDHLREVSGDGVTIQEDSARAAKDAAGAMTQLATAWNRFADKRLVGPIQTLAGWLDRLGAKNMDLALSFATTAAAILGVAVAGRKLYTGGMAVRGWMQSMSGAGGKGGGMAGAAGAMMGKTPLPVYVVNFGSGGGMGLNMPGAAGKGTGGAAGKMPKGKMGLGRGVGIGAAVLGTGLAGMSLYESATDDTKSYNEKVDEIGSTAGSLAGGLAGMAAGAAIGSIVPVVGTAVGAVAGGVLGLAGSYFGSELGSWVSDFFKEDEKPAAASDPLKDSSLAIRVEAVGDIRATVDQVRGPLDLDIRSGLSHSAMIGR